MARGRHQKKRSTLWCRPFAAGALALATLRNKGSGIPPRRGTRLIGASLLVALSSLSVLVLQQASAATTYGPSSPAWAAYYANPTSQSTWTPFCAGGGATTVINVLNEVPACGPAGSDNIYLPDGKGPTYPGFQCVELAERYLYVTQGLTPINSTNGDELVKNYGATDHIPVVQDDTGQLPQVGAVISFAKTSSFSDDGTDVGHVAIVTKVTSSAVTIVGENQSLAGNAETSTLKVTGNDVAGFGPDPHVEWMNPVPKAIPLTNLGPTTVPAGFQTIVTFACPTAANLLAYEYFDGVLISDQAPISTPSGPKYWVVTEPNASAGKHSVYFTCVANGQVLGTTAPFTLTLTPLIKLGVSASSVSPGETITVSDGGGFGSGGWYGNLLQDIIINNKDLGTFADPQLGTNASGDWGPMTVTIGADIPLGSTIALTATAVGPSLAGANVFATSDTVDLPVVAKPSGNVTFDHVSTDGGSTTSGQSVIGAIASIGSQIILQGIGFLPGELVSVLLHSTGTLLTTLKADSTGTVNGTVTIPTSTVTGSHQLVLSGETSGLVVSLPLTVTAASTSSPQPCSVFGPNVDLQNCNLSKADLAGMNLTGADLFNADLTGADLSGATLTGVILTDANLDGATLTGVTSGGIAGSPSALPLGWSLVGGYLLSASTTPTGVNLAGANLSGQNLTGVDLSGVNLTGANLSNADITGANLSAAILTDANLSDANLDEANLTGVVSGGIIGTPSALPSGWTLVSGQLLAPAST
jgi:Pentapeptide repeats (8 copies)/CHAP domain